MENFDGATMAGTWTWQRADSVPSPSPTPSPSPSPSPSPTPTPTPDSPPSGPIWREDLTLTETHFSYLIGTGHGRINPMGHITRAEVATILLRVMSEESRAEFWTTENTFTDVSEDEWFNNAVSTVAAAELMQGVELGRTPRFEPEGAPTRAEIATIIARFLDLEEMAAESLRLLDMSNGHWGYDEINLVVELGWMPEINGNFYPEVPIRRGEFAIVMNRVLERTRADIDERRIVNWEDSAPASLFFWDLQIASNSAPDAPAKNWEMLQRPSAVPEDVFR
jgi:hypothetical protein